jgi:hypothetical protein
VADAGGDGNVLAVGCGDLADRDGTLDVLTTEYTEDTKQNKGDAMARKKKTEVGDQGSEVGKPMTEDGGQTSETSGTEHAVKTFVDSSIVMKYILQRIPDDRLLDMADEINDRQFRVMELEEEIRSYTSSRKGEIKTLEEELSPLVRKFHEKTEMAEKEVRLITDFEAGTVQIETLTGELISEEAMPPTGFQREFAVLMEGEPGTELLNKAAEALKSHLDEERPDDEIVTSDMLESCLGGSSLNLSDSMAHRVVKLLRAKDVIRGRGYAGYPFVFCDPVAEAEAEKAQSEEISEDDILAAVMAINETNRATTSLLQRKLKVGYNRAARLMDILEERKVIGPVVENQPREILMDVEAYEGKQLPLADQED